MTEYNNRKNDICLPMPGGSFYMYMFSYSYNSLKREEVFLAPFCR